MSYKATDVKVYRLVIGTFVSQETGYLSARRSPTRLPNMEIMTFGIGGAMDCYKLLTDLGINQLWVNLPYMQVFLYPNVWYY